MVARYGGDEFAVLLLDAAPKDVDVIVTRVRDKLAVLAQQRRLPVSVEAPTGIAWSTADTAEEFPREADRDTRTSAKARKPSGTRPRSFRPLRLLRPALWRRVTFFRRLTIIERAAG